MGAVSAHASHVLECVCVCAQQLQGVLEEATSIEEQVNAMHTSVLHFVQQDQTDSKVGPRSRLANLPDGSREG